MTEKPDAPAHGSESENPAIDTPTPKTKRPRTTQDWWPDQLDLQVLRKHSATTDPMGGDFRYADEFATLDVEALKSDLVDLMTTSQDWWPADFGHYGGLFIRMSWHAAGTYRIADGRGGAGDGASASRRSTAGPTTRTSTRRAGSCGRSSRSTGARSRGPTCWCSPATSRWSRWASRRSASASAARTSGNRRRSSGARRTPGWATSATAATVSCPVRSVQSRWAHLRQPGGPERQPRPVAAARDIRETFLRMAMNDEETVALIAGGHTFGKTHGAASGDYVGPEPEGCPVDAQGLGWRNTYGSGKGADTITSGIEVTWTSTPTQWDNGSSTTSSATSGS
jgi:catalase-peroxidase